MVDSDEGSAARLDLLMQISRGFTSADTDNDQVSSTLVRGAAEILGGACALHLVDDDGVHVSTPHVAGWSPDDPELARWRAGRRPLAGEPELKGAIEGNATFFPSTDAGSASGRKMLVPVAARAVVVGVLAVTRTDAAPAFERRDVSFAEALAQQAALALAARQARLSATREIQRREAIAERLRVLAEASRDFAEATGDFERLLASVARRLGESLGDLCGVRAVNEAGDQLTRGACHHADPAVVAALAAVPGQQQFVGEGYLGRVAGNGETLFLPSVSPAAFAEQAHPAFRSLLLELGVGSAMVLPMKCREQVVGVAYLLRQGDARPYGEDDLSLARSITDHAALALMNARSYAAERAARAMQVVANEALAQSEMAHRVLIETSPTPIIVFDTETLENLAANQAALDLYGYDHAEFLRARVLLIGVELDETGARARLAEIGDREVSGSVKHRRKGGEVLTIEYTSRAFAFRGRPARIASLRDVTASAQADATRALLAAIVESSDDAIVSTLLDGTITSWNRSAQKLYGHAAADVVGRSVTCIVPPERHGEERLLLARVGAGEHVEHYETVRVRSDGHRVPVSLSLAPILDASGLVVGASKTARDLTAQRRAAEDLRRTEGQLRQAQKMEAVGRLAGGIAHDFNNALCVILSYGDMILAELAPDDPIAVDIGEIRSAAERAADLTRQLLMFSRQQVIEPRALDLDEVLLSMDGMLRRILGEDIVLATVRSGDLGCVRADRGSIEQVVMNLAVNARDAMPTGGTLTIETSRVVVDDHFAARHPGAIPGPHVLLAVTDSGCGMDADTQARAFEPFFTTKEPGRGTGLGLSTVFGIIQQSGGAISIYSEVGVGTSFKVYLPVIDGVADLTFPPASTVRPGTETVLLVEDQPQVRAVARGILARAGYDVLTAEDVEDAIRIATGDDRKIHILLTDLVMPGMSGAALAEQIASIRPDIKVLCMSGYTDDSVVRHGVLARGLPFLQKPFTPESLTTKLREVLEAPPTHFFR